MAASSWGVHGGFAILAIVLMGLACPLQAEAGVNEGGARDATPAAPKQQLTVDLGRGVKMELLYIPPGTFDMGSGKCGPNEKPVHEVTLKKAFYMGKYEVTQEQWQAVLGTNPSHYKDPKKPVENVNWNACRDFVAKLSKKTGRKFSLPSEAEWEYACRAGSTTEFCFGDDQEGLGEYAWYERNNTNWKTHPVGQKVPNKWGLYDMYGNVKEWCEDVIHHSYEGAPTDGSAWVEGGNQGCRVLRGGAWILYPWLCRSAYRDGSAPAYEGYADRGCRVVLRDF